MEVNASMMNSIASNLKNIDTDINNTIDSLLTECSNIDSNWDGLASDEYKNNLSNNLKVFKAYTFELESAIGLINQSLSDYTEIENKNVSLINSAFGNDE